MPRVMAAAMSSATAMPFSRAVIIRALGFLLWEVGAALALRARASVEAKRVRVALARLALLRDVAPPMTPSAGFVLHDYSPNFEATTPIESW